VSDVVTRKAEEEQLRLVMGEGRGRVKIAEPDGCRCRTEGGEDVERRRVECTVNRAWTIEDVVAEDGG